MNTATSPDAPKPDPSSSWQGMRAHMKLEPHWAVVMVALWFAAPRLVGMATHFLGLGPEAAAPEGMCHYDYATSQWWPYWSHCLRLGIALAGVLWLRLGIKQPLACQGMDAPRVFRRWSDTRFLLLMLGIAGGVFALLIGGLYAAFILSPDQLGAQPGQSFLHWMRGMSAIRDLSWQNALLMVVYAPIIEEVVFRGWLYAQVRTLFTSMWPALIVSAFFFAFSHDNALPISQLIGGFVFGYAFERTRQIWVPILLHIAGNGSLFLLSMLTESMV